jgi:hypothetical protein
MAAGAASPRDQEFVDRKAAVRDAERLGLLIMWARFHDRPVLS